jgi:murein DD-endopeptidase MepM/ murein hydrolase activator NlpD
MKKVIDERKLDATKADSIFREKVESKDRFPIQNTTTSNIKIVFFAPLTGFISQKFDPNSKHFAIDIVAKTGSPIKAIADGTVIFFWMDYRNRVCNFVKTS